jgi:hypothetical protein
MSLFRQIPLLLRLRRSPEKGNQQRDQLASEAKGAEDETNTDQRRICGRAFRV